MAGTRASATSRVSATPRGRQTISGAQRIAVKAARTQVSLGKKVGLRPSAFVVAMAKDRRVK